MAIITTPIKGARIPGIEGEKVFKKRFPRLGRTCRLVRKRRGLKKGGPHIFTDACFIRGRPSSFQSAERQTRWLEIVSTPLSKHATVFFVK